MKNTILALFVGMISLSAWSQLQTPQPSPASKLEQKVGLTDVTVEYSRPAMRGRTIFGDLVPYKSLWRTGANRNTMVSFSDEVTIGGNSVAAGSYAIFTVPDEQQWVIYIYNDINNWGTPGEWDDAKVVARVESDVYKMPMNVESFTITIDDVSNNSAVIGILWENVYVGIPFEVPTKKKTMANIEALMSGPSAGDYYSAASYYLAEGLDIEKAKMWIDKAVAGNPKAYWVVRAQSLIYAKSGDKKGAVEAAKKSLALAEEAGNMDYVKMNKDSLKEWGAM